MCSARALMGRLLTVIDPTNWVVNHFLLLLSSWHPCIFVKPNSTIVYDTIEAHRYGFRQIVNSVVEHSRSKHVQ